jgi:hypothetical protein
VILRELLTIVGDDREVVELLLEAGVIEAPLEREFTDEEAELARVARVLLRELDVNLAGIEVILRMRQEVVALRQQMADLIRMLQETGVRHDPSGPR